MAPGPPDGRTQLATQPTGASKTLVKALTLLQLVSRNPAGLTLAECSRETGLPKPSAHRVLQTLVDHGLLRFDGEGTYRLGTQCLVLGTSFLDNLDIREESRGLLVELMRHTGETCHLGVRDGSRIVYIDKVETSHAMTMRSRIGSTQPVHSTGLGKAILAHAERRVVEEVIAGGLTRRTPATLTDPDALRADLERTRRRGHSIDDVENEEGVRCVGAPILDHHGDVVAGVSVAGPEHRMTDDRIGEIAERVRATAVAISRRLGYQGSLPLREGSAGTGDGTLAMRHGVERSPVP